MNPITVDDLKKLYIPPQGSHKGQNGRLLVIGGSHLFHAASLWALTVASRIVDLVHYSSVPENNEIVLRAKEEFRNGIVIQREDLDAYIEEDDCMLIGPGMERTNETEELTNRLLKRFPKKQWVIDAGALQMMDISLIPKNAILTPHHGEFEMLWSKSQISNFNDQTISDQDKVKLFAKEYQCTLLLKGEKDIACSGGDCGEKYCAPGECRVIEGGNAGMTKGGTGDVLAGLIAALACKNDPFLAAIAGSFINKKAGDALYARVGPYFNATDLASEIPGVMKELLMSTQNLFLQFFYELCELVGDGDGESGNQDGVEKKRQEAATRWKIRFDLRFHELLNNVVPGEGCHQAEAGGGQRDHLLQNFFVQLLLL